MRLVRRFRRPHPLVLAIFSTIGAGALVFSLQYRANSALQSIKDGALARRAEAV